MTETVQQLFQLLNASHRLGESKESSVAPVLEWGEVA